MPPRRAFPDYFESPGLTDSTHHSDDEQDDEMQVDFYNPEDAEEFSDDGDNEDDDEADQEIGGRAVGEINLFSEADVDFPDPPYPYLPTPVYPEYSGDERETAIEDECDAYLDTPSAKFNNLTENLQMITNRLNQDAAFQSGYTFPNDLIRVVASLEETRPLLYRKIVTTGCTGGQASLLTNLRADIMLTHTTLYAFSRFCRDVVIRFWQPERLDADYRSIGGWHPRPIAEAIEARRGPYMQTLRRYLRLKDDDETIEHIVEARNLPTEAYQQLDDFYHVGDEFYQQLADYYHLYCAMWDFMNSFVWFSRYIARIRAEERATAMTGFAAARHRYAQ